MAEALPGGEPGVVVEVGVEDRARERVTSPLVVTLSAERILEDEPGPWWHRFLREHLGADRKDLVHRRQP